MLTEAEKTAFSDAAKSLVGVKWRGQGRDRNGVDCCGVPVFCFRAIGKTVKEGDVDYRNVDPRRMVETILSHADRIPHGAAPEVGDVIVFGIPHEVHIGVLVRGRPLNMIHSPLMGKVVEARFDPKRGNIRGIYRWRS